MEVHMFTTLAARALLMMSEGISLEEAVIWFTRNIPRSLRSNSQTQIKIEVAKSIL